MEILKIKNAKVKYWKEIGQDDYLFTRKERHYIVELTEKEFLILLLNIKEKDNERRRKSIIR